MARLEIRPFSDEFLEPAGELLAARHRAHRTAEPLLPARYEDPAAARTEVEGLLALEGASGTVALRDGRVVGYLLGVRKNDALWGANVWVEHAGHAVEAAEDLRDLYAAAAQGWVDDDARPRHYVLAPATDPALIEAWSRVGFGQQHGYGIQAVPSGSWPEGVRLATAADVEALLDLDPLLSDHQAESPVFARGLPKESREELRAELLEDLAKEEVGDLVVERDGRMVGAFGIVPVELSSVDTGVVTDWRVTNLLPSRFWPARGFRSTFLRLYRHIP